MSENRRYYWLKLQETFFEDDTIDFIESQENGEKYVLFYLKLCLKALKNEGKLIRYVGELLMPYDEAGIAKLTNTDIDTVRSALILFSNIGLIKRLETGEIYLTQLNELIGSETSDAQRKRRQRINEKARMECDSKAENVTFLAENVTPMSQISHTDIEIDIEKEKDIDTHSNGVLCAYSGISENQKGLGKIQIELFKIITEYNKTASIDRKIPISKDIMSFVQKESRELFSKIGTNEPAENVKQAILNYIQVAQSDTWKNTFTWSNFCNKYVEFTSEYFSLSNFLNAEYEGTDSTKKPENVFYFAMKDNPRFNVDLFESHVKDWKDAGRPQGEAYFKLQKEWEVA